MPSTWSIRSARDEDATGLIALISAVFDEYPGCVMDVDGEAPELRRIASTFATRKGSFWVAEVGDALVGCVGFTPAIAGNGLELRKLYVAKGMRGTGLGGELSAMVEDEAGRRGSNFVELWSDTRFERAHAFYRRRGYVQGPQKRDLHDKSASVEYYFRLEFQQDSRR